MERRETYPEAEDCTTLELKVCLLEGSENERYNMIMN